MVFCRIVYSVKWHSLHKLHRTLIPGHGVMCTFFLMSPSTDFPSLVAGQEGRIAAQAIVDSIVALSPDKSVICNHSNSCRQCCCDSYKCTRMVPSHGSAFPLPCASSIAADDSTGACIYRTLTKMPMHIRLITVIDHKYRDNLRNVFTTDSTHLDTCTSCSTSWHSHNNRCFQAYVWPCRIAR